jgi:hypothetical protein
VSSFVRSIAGAGDLTIAALDPDTEPAVVLPVLGEAGAVAVSGGGTRVLQPRLPVSQPAFGQDGSAGRRASLAVLSMVVISAGLAALWLGRGRLVERPAPAAATIASPAPTAAAPSMASTPNPPSPIVAAPTVAAAIQAPTLRAKPERARRIRTLRAEAKAPPPQSERWSPDSALPPPP